MWPVWMAFPGLWDPHARRLSAACRRLGGCGEVWLPLQRVGNRLRQGAGCSGHGDLKKWNSLEVGSLRMRKPTAPVKVGGVGCGDTGCRGWTLLCVPRSSGRVGRGSLCTVPLALRGEVAE